LNEAVEGLNVTTGKWYIDATIGGGGHTGEIVQRGGKVFGIDRDSQAIDEVTRRFANEIELGLVKVVKGNFSHITKLTIKHSIPDIHGVLFDLGISTHQLQKMGRGFSFLRDEPLDMRMSQSEGVKAAEIVNSYSWNDLTEVFQKYGEEVNAGQIAEKIVQVRKQKPIASTKELADLIERVAKGHQKRIHPATKIFQALRIEVNEELHELKTALPQVLEVLSPKGRIAIISFHSLEDRIAKQFFKNKERENQIRIITKKPIVATDNEIAVNAKARSAKLRIIEKI